LPAVQAAPPALSCSQCRTVGHILAAGLSSDLRPIIGRDAGLELVDSFLARVPGGTPVLVIEGDPGIGKTTVWLEAIRRAEAKSFRVLKAGPAESEATLPYAALGDLVGEAFAQVGSTLPGPQERALATALLLADSVEAADSRTTATAVVSLVTTLAGERPVVVAIDDAQWLDAASDRLLAFAVRRLPKNAGVLLTRRPQPSGKLPLGLTAAADRHEVLRLGGLSLAALQNIITNRLETSLARPVLVRVATASEGNPFFALETARMLRDQGATSAAQPLPLPSSLREVVAGHVRGLSATAWEAVTISAALSRPTFQAIGAALGSEANALAALNEAEGAGVVTLDGDRIRFAHPLLAWGVYGSLSAPQRRLLHRRLANMTDDLEERARHLALSEPEPDEETAQQLEAAARHAARRGAHEAAAELFSAACRLTPAGRPIELARRMLGQSSASLVTGDVEGVRNTASRVVEAAPVASMKAEALVLLSDAAWVGGLPRVAADHLEAALALAGTDRDLAPQVLAKLVEVFAVLDPAQALAYSQAAVERVSEERDPRLLAHALFNHVYAQAVLGRRPDIGKFKRGLELEARAGPEARPSSIPLIWYQCIDDFDAVRARHAMEHRWYREHGDEAGVAERLGHISHTEFRAGHWDLAEQYIERSFTTIQQFEPEGSRAGPWIVARYIHALIDAHRGRTNRARAMLAPMLEETRKREQSFWAAILLSWLAVVEFIEGRHEAVDRALTASRERIESMGAVEVVGIRSEPIHIESLVALGQLERAHDVLARLEARGRAFPRLWITVTLPRARALVAAGEGDLASAIGEMTDIDSKMVRLLPLERGHNLLVFGRLLRRAKQRGAAAEALTEAAAVFEQLGAPTWLAQARSELDRVGLRRAPQQLTATERRVAELAASGMTNKEVAATLFISPKTVEANLARAYSKLGIKSRAELGARVKELRSLSQT